MPDLEMVAFGVLQAGVQWVYEEGGKRDPGEVLEVLVEVVCDRLPGVTSEQADAALKRACVKMRDRSCN